jgi:2-polyprenyl-6-methoxyphenol hydroxylase-like FAD-dependent oxidoreductase
MGHALVIGGSLGGLFAGLLLRQAGWDVTVFERSAGDLAGRGVGIGTHVELFDVMRRLGITIDETIGVAATSRVCLGRDGAVIARLPHDKILSAWARLYRALKRHLPDARYRPGMELTDVTQHAGRVTAVFADGTKGRVISWWAPTACNRRCGHAPSQGLSRAMRATSGGAG